MLKTAVVGLGKIGFMFDLDPLRKEIWSHSLAYKMCTETELSGSVEIDSEKIAIFKRHYPDVPVFSTVKEMMERVVPDIVSICTPTYTHYSVLMNLAGFPVKGIFCEKPIASTVEEAEKMVLVCEEREIVLSVNHIRRWDNNYIRAAQLIAEGKIGKVKGVIAIYSGQVFNIGTHLFDTINMLIGGNAVSVSGILHGSQGGDCDISGWIKFNSGVFCNVLATGNRENLLFEIDVIGSDGRLRIVENGKKIEWFRFENSLRYSGYRELVLNPLDDVENKDRFVAAMEDIVMVVKGSKKQTNCSGRNGLAALSISLGMLESSQNNGHPSALGALMDY